MLTTIFPDKAQILPTNSTRGYAGFTKVRLHRVPALGYSSTSNLISASSEKANITDRKAIEENLALGEHVKKGTFFSLSISYGAGAYLVFVASIRGLGYAELEEI